MPLTRAQVPQELLPPPKSRLRIRTRALFTLDFTMPYPPQILMSAVPFLEPPLHAGLASRLDSESENESVPSLHRKSSARTYKVFTIETLVEPLVSAFKDNDASYISTFLSTYRSFGTTKQVLEVLFKKYGYIPGNGGPQDQIKNAISSILGLWLNQYPEDFYELPDFPCLRLLVDYTGLNMPGSELEQRARLLLAHMEHLKPTEAEPEAPEPALELHRVPASALVAALELEAAPPAAPESAPSPAPAVTPELRQVLAPTPGPSWPSLVSTMHEMREEKLNILSFPPKLVAEQLTMMDVELFKKVVPYDCLGSIWSQRKKKGKEHLAPTVRATVTQFNSVVHCVITTCLGDRSMKAPDRASVVEHWIEVARECLIHRNFSSLHAILSALQSTPISRLKDTWAEVSSHSSQTFKKLCKNKNTLIRDLPIKLNPAGTQLGGQSPGSVVGDRVKAADPGPPAGREELVSSLTPCETLDTLLPFLGPLFSYLENGREGISKFATLKMNPKRAQKGQQQKGVIQGTVPYLGVYLTDLVMLDTALPDFLDGGLINFQKRRKEFSVLQEIKLLQWACQHYTIMAQEQFETWFQGMERLTETESYNLSCELEPRTQQSSKKT
ncbi:ral guanine nucleotide dissociation stimulator-like [Trichechus manatus latirostris]|uniref:Ral guanine nucleotide dissociation stimulator-like n=1 Tax=Trichechus manatus latirostris TaxID=127582 RepID=A0A2Y9G1Q2_TRIMA|nr:ral guanine nucleotide dissociation stimulator-like [Trichechus manatus latirostris]